MYTDSHCHLNFPELLARLDDIRQDMQAAQVTRALLISTQLETFDEVNRIAMAYDNFWCTAGVHPDEDDVQEYEYRSFDPCFSIITQRITSSGLR
jgi:TatD DNase family protein